MMWTKKYRVLFICLWKLSSFIYFQFKVQTRKICNNNFSCVIMNEPLNLIYALTASQGVMQAKTNYQQQQQQRETGEIPN